MYDMVVCRQILTDRVEAITLVLWVVVSKTPIEVHKGLSAARAKAIIGISIHSVGHLKNGLILKTF